MGQNLVAISCSLLNCLNFLKFYPDLGQILRLLMVESISSVFTKYNGFIFGQKWNNFYIFWFHRLIELVAISRFIVNRTRDFGTVTLNSSNFSEFLKISFTTHIFWSDITWFCLSDSYSGHIFPMNALKMKIKLLAGFLKSEFSWKIAYCIFLKDCKIFIYEE